MDLTNGKLVTKEVQDWDARFFHCLSDGKIVKEKDVGEVRKNFGNAWLIVAVSKSSVNLSKDNKRVWIPKKQLLAILLETDKETLLEMLKK